MTSRMESSSKNTGSSHTASYSLKYGTTGKCMSIFLFYCSLPVWYCSPFFVKILRLEKLPPAPEETLCNCFHMLRTSSEHNVYKLVEWPIFVRYRIHTALDLRLDLYNPSCWTSSRLSFLSSEVAEAMQGRCFQLICTQTASACSHNVTLIEFKLGSYTVIDNHKCADRWQYRCHIKRKGQNPAKWGKWRNTLLRLFPLFFFLTQFFFF